jgi:dihydroorotate dehydrogenase (NAD+) catalytic subunit
MEQGRASDAADPAGGIARRADLAGVGVAGPKRSLAVDLGGIELPTPVMIASGCGGTGRELSGAVDLHRVGAIVSRTITVEPRKGTPTPRVIETPSGIVWSTGLQNPGLIAFVDEELPRLARGVRVIVSIGGTSLESFVRLASALRGLPEVGALELYLSEPDEEMGRSILGAREDRLAEVVGAVARMSSVPVFAKLPSGGPTADLVRAAAHAGATGVTLSSSPPAFAVDTQRLRPALGGVTGWLAGPAIRPLTLRAVVETARALPSFPIIASGGIATGADAVQALLAGAWAVQVGTAMLVDPAAPVDIARELVRSLKSKGFASPSELRGRLRFPDDLPEAAR